MPNRGDDWDGKAPPEIEHAVTDGGWSALGRILKALANKRNRYVCYYLTETDPADIEACAKEIAAWEQDIPPTEVSAAGREQVETLLYHHHLPQLAELGIIEYDQRSGDIRFQYPPPHFEELLALARRIEMDDGETA